MNFPTIDYIPGMRIAQPCVVRGMPIDVYHGDVCAGPSISSTGLRVIYNESPAHYFASSPYCPEDQRVEREPSRATTLGSAAHHMLVGGVGEFKDHYIIRPERVRVKIKSGPNKGKLETVGWNGNRTECREWLKAMTNAGKTVLTDEDVKHVQGMALALGRHPDTSAGLLDGLIERSAFWQDDETGVWLRIRPDVIPTDSGDFADIKTTRSVLYHRLVSTLDDYSYPMQAALVATGCPIVFGFELAEFCFVFIESAPPYCVRPMLLKTDEIARGMKQNRIAIRRFADCISSGKWPGPGDGDLGYIERSDRARERIDEQLNYQFSESEAPL